MDPAFTVYCQELIKWNQKFNLTAITDPEQIKVKHFEDSLTILQVIELTNQTVLDIGPGAGFPGIPLKIKRPGIKLTLIEATKKKTEFLKHIVKLLELTDVEIIWGRAENFSGQFDLVLARAVAKLPQLVSYALPYLKKGGIFIAQKGKEIEDTLVQIDSIKKITLSNGDQRNLILIKKV